MNWQDISHVLQKTLGMRLFDLAGKPVSLASLLAALVIIIATFWLSRLIERAVFKASEMRGLADTRTPGVIGRLLHYVLLIVGGVIALQVVGIDLSTLFAAGAIFAVGIGFAMQNIVQNFVSGIILLIERAIKPGDILEIEGQVVKVVRMGIRATIVRTRLEENLIVPNSVFVQSTVKNFTLEDNVFRLHATVGVTYSSDIVQVRETLEAVAKAIPFRLPDHPSRVLLTAFGDNAVEFEIAVWMQDPWEARVALSELHEAVWHAFQTKGIVIAFPQVDVHLDEPVVGSLQKMAGAA